MKQFRKQILIVVAIVFVLSLLLALGIRALLPNDEATINKAIKTNNPALCDKIKQISRPGAEGKQVKVTGVEAVKICKDFVAFGSRPE